MTTTTARSPQSVLRFHNSCCDPHQPNPVRDRLHHSCNRLRPIRRASFQRWLTAAILLGGLLVCWPLHAIALQESDNATVEDSFSAAVDRLSHRSFTARREAQQQLQEAGYAAADYLLTLDAANADLDQREVVGRLVQHLPDLDRVLQTLSPDLPPALMVKFRTFPAMQLSDKVATLRLLERYPDAAAQRTILFCIARFDRMPLIRHFAAISFLENHSPVEPSRYYAFSSRHEPILERIPDRAPSPTPNHSVLGAEDWILGNCELICKSGDIYELAGGLPDRPMVSEAQSLRDFLRASQTGSRVSAIELINTIEDQIRNQAAVPLMASSPLEFQLKTEVAVRAARWAITQAQTHPALSQQWESLESSLSRMAQDPEIFQAQAVLLCDFAVRQNRVDWLDQWQDQHQDLWRSQKTPPTVVLPLMDAINQLQGPGAGEIWLHQNLAMAASRPVLVQYAVLAGELGYETTQLQLLHHVARLPIDGQLASLWAKILYAEALGARCDAAGASNQLAWLLTYLQTDHGLRHKAEKLLPDGLDALRARYHYFAAQEACHHWDWQTAARHVAIGHQLAPYNTNLLNLAWEIQLLHADQPITCAWNPVDERKEFLHGQRCLTATAVPTEPNPPVERHSDFSRSDLSQHPDATQPYALPDEWSRFSPLAFGFDATIQIPLLTGAYLEAQTQRALEHFEHEIREAQLEAGGVSSRPLQAASQRRLGKYLNRWAFLAASTGQQPELAYQRAAQASTLSDHQPAYFDTLSLCAQKSGRIAEAIQATQMAVSLAPHDMDFRTRLATLQNVAQIR